MARRVVFLLALMYERIRYIKEQLARLRRTASGEGGS